jgi:hypothetical protein
MLSPRERDLVVLKFCRRSWVDFLIWIILLKLPNLLLQEICLHAYLLVVSRANHITPPCMRQ